MNICPAYVHLRSGKDKNRNVNNNEKFYSETYPLIDDERIDHLGEIRTNTPYPVSIRLFICQNLKDQPENYCGKLFNPPAKKKLCESNKTDYVFFYMDKSEHERSENKPKEGPVYMLAFARYPKKNEETHKAIVTEVKKTAVWLGVAGSDIQCYVFYYSPSNFPCNTFDLGTFKKKYDDQCRDPKYSFQCSPIAPNPKKNFRFLNIHGGLSQFTIEVKG